MFKDEVANHRWLRSDGHQLVWTSRCRLLERQGPGQCWVSVRSPCTYQEAIVKALVGGFKWVRSLDGGDDVARRGAVTIARCDDGGVTDYVIDATKSLWWRKRRSALSVWASDVKVQPMLWRAQREFKIRLRMLHATLHDRGE